MLWIKEYYPDNNCRNLNLTENLFHKALLSVMRGERRFHVLNPFGDDFDLVYEDNNEITLKERDFPPGSLFRKQVFSPPYLSYDENDDSKLYLDVFDGFDTVVFDSLNEYSIVIAGILLKHTDKRVVFTDERIRWFINSPALTVCKTEEVPDLSAGTTMHVADTFQQQVAIGDFQTCWHINLFHNVFVLQWLTDMPLSKIKYMEAAILDTEGIGSLINNVLRMQKACDKYGWRVFLKSGSSRFGEEMLSRYFRIDSKKSPDANDENTIYVTSFFATVFSHLVISNQPEINANILSEHFLNDLREYSEAVLGNKRMLGVLVRGTDYVVSGIAYRALPAEELIRKIKERMEEYQYDGIFLATEDQDYFEQLSAAFPKKLRAISQERHRVSDFAKAVVLSELEKEKRSGRAYNALVEDTTINYFYALFLLSQCESFISSPDCNGAIFVRSFNEGRFVRDETLFSVHLGE